MDGESIVVPVEAGQPVPIEPEAVSRERVLRVIVAATFLLFFQTYMVAPLIPSLADALRVDRQRIGLLIPAYTIPYGIAALIYGALADRFGRRRLLLAALAGFPVVGLAMAASPSFGWLLGLRILSGIVNVGMIVSGMSLIGDLFPPGERGHALGWFFGAIAGGGAFGSTLGGLLAPWTGWRGLFALVALSGVVVFVGAVRSLGGMVEVHRPAEGASAAAFVAGYGRVLRSSRAARTYGYIFLNAMFHSGVFTWLGVLFRDRYGLGEVGIGLALLGYGVPGFLLGPAIGRVVDRYGRRWIIPAGLVIAASTAFTMAPRGPLWVAVGAVTVLSLGFDMTHPLLAGIATTLDDRRRGQAMGLNTFSIFVGLGCGSLLFGGLMQRVGMSAALLAFGAVQAMLGVVALRLFRRE